MSDPTQDPVAAVRAFLSTVQELNSADLNVALQELKRRDTIEKRLALWLSGDQGDLRSIIRSVLGVKLKNYRTGKEWFASPDQSGGADDHWSWTNAALDAAEAP